MLSRDDNFCPTPRYPTQLNPNGLSFTWPDKEQGWVWGLVKIRPEPDLFRIKIKLQKNLYIYIYIFITYNLTLTLTSLILTHSSFSLMPAAPLLHPHTLLPLVTLTLIPASPLPTTAPFVPTPHCLSPATSLPPCVSTGPPRSLSFSFSFSFLFFFWVHFVSIM